ncbi:MAG: hypothetical protein FVQ79_02280 [Planctomycetes bacterium]|nr:hypothetical protein [Planctomycetota bacterium]
MAGRSGAEKLLLAAGEMREDELVDSFGQIRETDPELGEELRKEWLLPTWAGKFDPVGYESFYEVIMQQPLPFHARPWVRGLFTALEEGLRGLMLQAFRGSTKTTIISYLFTAFRLGHRPQGSSLIIRINDKSGQRTARRIARMIELSKNWKKIFPNVIPHKEVAWGAEIGYEFRDKRFDLGEWRDIRELEGGEDNPSILGLGIGSGEIIGKHPTNILNLDDIHNRKNTESMREMKVVKETVVTDIFPTIVPGKTIVTCACTPWVEDDAYAMFESTGQYKKVMTPAYIVVDQKGGVVEESWDPDEEGWESEKEKETADLGNGYGEIVEYEGESVRMAWPEVFTPDELDIKRAESDALGMADFARMYLLDLEKAKGIHLKREWVSDWSVDKIEKHWPIIFGVDYASATDQRKEGKTDYFSVSIGTKIPWGGVILLDGFLEVLTQGEADLKLNALAAIWRPQVIGMEAVGSGREFYTIMQRTSKLPIVPYTASKSKSIKFEHEMAPMFQFNKAYVSSHYTPFIIAFLKSWTNWDGSGRTIDDPLDSTYWMMRTAVGSLMPKHGETTRLQAERLTGNLDHSPHFGRKLK